MSFSSTISMTNLQKVTLHTQCMDVSGSPFDAPSKPSWSNSNNSAATIIPAADGLSCDVTGVTTGFTDVTVTVGEKETTTRIQVNAPILNVVQIMADDPVMQ